MTRSQNVFGDFRQKGEHERASITSWIFEAGDTLTQNHDPMRHFLFLLLLLASIPAQAQHTIQVKVAIIYQLGGPQPVAHEEFRLLSQSADKLLSRAFGMIPADVQEDEESKPPAPGEIRALKPKPAESTSLFKISGLGHYTESCRSGLDDCGKGLDLIIKHTVKRGRSDFSGNVVFEGLEEGTYYIFGITLTRADEEVVWDVPVVVPSSSSTELSQHNASYSR